MATYNTCRWCGKRFDKMKVRGVHDNSNYCSARCENQAKKTGTKPQSKVSTKQALLIAALLVLAGLLASIGDKCSNKSITSPTSTEDASSPTETTQAKSKNKKVENYENKETISDINSDETEAKPDLKVLQTEFTPLVELWNQAHSLDNIDIFYQLFDNTVLFYGSKLSKNECIAKKQSSLNKYPDFEQMILNSVEIEEYATEQYKCSFIKRVTIEDKSTDYHAYLIFRKYGNNWKIVAESDVITDRNLAKKR